MDAVYRATRPLLVSDIRGYIVVMQAFRALCIRSGNKHGAVISLMALHSASMVTGPPNRQRTLGHMMVREAPSPAVLMSVGTAEEACGHPRAAARWYAQARIMASKARNSDLVELIDLKLERLRRRTDAPDR